MNEELFMQYGVPLLSLAAGWFARHFHLGMSQPAPTTPTPMIPAPTPLSPDQRLAQLEAMVAQIFAAIAKPATPPTPTIPAV